MINSYKATTPRTRQTSPQAFMYWLRMYVAASNIKPIYTSKAAWGGLEMRLTRSLLQTEEQVHQDIYCIPSYRQYIFE